ncbi:hypothetical protein DSUL_20225 [Desulfovibrionales bacterium]
MIDQLISNIDYHKTTTNTFSSVNTKKYYNLSTSPPILLP